MTEVSEEIQWLEDNRDEMMAYAEDVDRRLRIGMKRQQREWLEWKSFAWTTLQPARAGHLRKGTSGDWSIQKFSLTPRDEQADRMRAALSESSRNRYCVTGDYTRLVRSGSVVMSDTPDEMFDLLPLWHGINPGDKVIINGLGLGCAVRIALMQGASHVDVVELSRDVIKLVGKEFQDDDRVDVYLGDAYTFQWSAGTRWDAAWHDIWDQISIDNDFATLHRRYGHRVNWQASWCRQEAIRSDRRWRKEMERWRKS